MSYEYSFFLLLAFFLSATIHEYAHGWVANYLGDSTARYAGRLTLNPLAHIDIWGSIIVPLFLLISRTGFIIGWMKPVPFNPYNLRDQKYGTAKVAAAGPLSNFFLALLFGLILRILTNVNSITSPFYFKFLGLITIIVWLNLILMVFNLMPIPPLDGSKILSVFLPYRGKEFLARLEPYGMILIFAFVFFAFRVIIPITLFLFQLLAGQESLILFIKVFSGG